MAAHDSLLPDLVTEKWWKNPEMGVAAWLLSLRTLSGSLFFYNCRAKPVARAHRAVSMKRFNKTSLSRYAQRAKNGCLEKIMKQILKVSLLAAAMSLVITGCQQDEKKADAAKPEAAK